jgi:hypothetical protein
MLGFKSSNFEMFFGARGNYNRLTLNSEKYFLLGSAIYVNCSGMNSRGDRITKTARVGILYINKRSLVK